MTNEELSGAIYELKLSPRMENMAWLAFFNESSWLEDFFLRNRIEDVKKIFPQYDEGIETMVDVSYFLTVQEKNGFLAEIHFPSIISTQFDVDGTPKMTRTTFAICAVAYIYGETIEDFFNEVVKAHDEELNRQIDKIKSTDMSW